MNEEKSEKEKYLQELVLAKLEIMPNNYKLSVGNQGTFTKEQLMNHVKTGSEVGKQLIEMEVGFAQALARGEFTKLLLA